MDLRFALRYLRRNPGFSLGAMCVLALGMGANTAIFSIINAVLLRPLDYPDPGRIVAVEALYKNTGKTGATMSAPDFHDIRRQSTTMQAMAYYVGGEASAFVNGRAEYADSRYVSAEFFRVFALPAVAGRTLEPGDDKRTVAVVSHRWALGHFGSASGAIGKTAKVRSHAVEIVGVAAPGFHYPATADLWLPVGLIPENSHRTAHNYTVVGRVKPDIAVMTAGEELRIIGDRLERQHPENRFKSVAITPLQGRLTRSVQSTLWVLLGAVALVLLIACANVANLLLARATARTREIALRTAVGASRSRIVRQLVTESMMLGACSSGLGVVIALLALDGLLLLAPPSVPGLDRVTLDARVLVFSLGVGILSSLLFGLAPAIQASRVDLNTALRASGGKGAVGSGHSARTRSVLVVAEIALSVVLLIGAGLLLRSYQALTRVDLGFATERTLIAQISTPAADEAAAQRATHFRRTLIENVRNLPGVTGAAGTWATPLGEIRSNAAYFIQGRPAGRPGEYPFADMHVVSPGYFRTMGIELVRGRDFNDSDEFGRPQVVIVNEAFVRTAFEKADPLGHRLRTGFTLESAEGMQIIGVARDIRASDPGTPASPELYLPYLQHPSVGSRLALVIRTGLEPSALEEAIRSTIKRLDPEVPVRFQTMEAVHARALSYPRFRTLLITCFAVLAAVLAAIGIYSVLAYLVSQRTAEIGVRIALGADANDVLRLVAGNALRLTAVGLAAGAVVAWAASKALASMVYGISPGDPVTYLGAVVVTGLSATLASTAPAMRATRIDPVVALRQD